VRRDDTLNGLDKIRRDIPRLRVALRLRDKSPSVVGVVTGGAPSYELISLAVDALLTDIRQGVDHCERACRAELGHAFHRTPDLPDALARLATAYTACETAPTPSPAAETTAALVAVWVHRAAVLLGDAWRPYPLVAPDGRRVRCPVVEWREGAATECTGNLWVHRHDTTGVPTEITCKRDKAHAWRTGPAWLRLGALLGAIR
jgi:hypothetical protein